MRESFSMYRRVFYISILCILLICNITMFFLWRQEKENHEKLKLEGTNVNVELFFEYYFGTMNSSIATMNYLYNSSEKDEIRDLLIENAYAKFIASCSGLSAIFNAQVYYEEQSLYELKKGLNGLNMILIDPEKGKACIQEDGQQLEAILHAIIISSKEDIKSKAFSQAVDELNGFVNAYWFGGGQKIHIVPLQ